MTVSLFSQFSGHFDPVCTILIQDQETYYTNGILNEYAATNLQRAYCCFFFGWVLYV